MLLAVAGAGGAWAQEEGTVARAPEEAAKFLGDREPTSVWFAIIDTGVYALLFLLGVLLLWVALRVIARHERPLRGGPYWAAGALVVLVGLFTHLAKSFGAPEVAKAAFFFLASVVILHRVCHATWWKAVVAVVVLGGGVASAAIGAQLALNQVLPIDRETLVQRADRALGLVDEMAHAESTPFFTKENLRLVWAGLTLQGEAMASAVVLLRDPEVLNDLVAEHQEDLRALGLLVDGEGNTAEDLAELGIEYVPGDPGLRGVEVLLGASEKTEFTEQDVEDVAAFLRSVRQGRSEVTPEDVAVVIREAMRHARPVAVDPAQQAALAAEIGADAAGAGEMQVISVFTKARLWPESTALQGLPPAEQAAWMAALEAIEVTATVRFRGRLLIKVNGRFVRPGDVVTVERDGRTHRFLLKAARVGAAEWEPVVTAG